MLCDNGEVHPRSVLDLDHPGVFDVDARGGAISAGMRVKYRGTLQQDSQSGSGGCL